jgi:hypothetical protein
MYDVVLALAALVFIAVSFWYVRSGYFSVYHPFTLYLAFHGFLFVVRPIVARAMDFRFVYLLYNFTPSGADKIDAILISIVGLLSFAFFCFRQGNLPMRFNIDAITIEERRALRLPFYLVGAICFPIGFYSLYRLWDASNNDMVLATMAMDKTTRILVNTEGSGYLKEAQLMLATCGAILAWLLRFRLLAVLPLAIFVVLRAGTGGRGPFVAAAATLGLLWLYERRQRWPSPRLLLGLALLLVVFNTVGVDRGRSIRQWFGTDKTLDHNYSGQPDLLPLEGMDFANLEYLEYVVYAVPQRTHSYSYFTEELQLFTEPIPRTLWAGKPFGSPIQMFNLFKYGNPIGMTVTLPGTGWAGAGWLGVIFWCGLWGYVLGLIYRKYALGPQSAFHTIAYMTLLSSLIVAYRDGGLVTLARQNIFYMAPILLWLVFARQMGIPSVGELRQLLAARVGRPMRRLTAHTAAGPLVPAAEAADGGGSPRPTPWLPPAVARRRAVLAAAHQPPA